MVRTIAGLANRQSSAMLPTPSRALCLLGIAVGRWEKVRARGSGSAVWGDRQQTIIRELVEICRDAALRDPEGLCHLPRCGTRMPCHVREDNTICAIASLQEILAEKAGCTDGNTEPCGDREVVTGRLASPGI